MINCFFLFAKFNVEARPCVRACLASDASETVEVVIVQLGTVTASEVRMHHVFIILTLTFIQCHTDLTHESNNCLVIS